MAANITSSASGASLSASALHPHSPAEGAASKLKGKLVSTWSHLSPSYGTEKELKSVVNFLRAFSQDLKIKGDSEARTMLLAGSGATDITLICTSDNLMKFIFKNTRPALLENSKMCCFIFKKLGMIAPEITDLKEEPVGLELFSKFAKAKELHGPKASKIQSMLKTAKQAAFCFMKAFEGRNLEDFIPAYTESDSLSVDFLRNLYTHFGEVAVYDLLIGNDDRFFRFSEQMIATPDQPVDYQIFLNPGNIMIDTDDDETVDPSTARPTLKQVLCIDNGSFNNLNDKLQYPNYADLLEHQAGNFIRAFREVLTEEGRAKFINSITINLKSGGALSPSDFNMHEAIEAGLIFGLRKFAAVGPELVGELSQFIKTQPSESPVNLLQRKLIEMVASNLSDVQSCRL